MATLPKIDSEGLRLAKVTGAAKVSSAARVTVRESKAAAQARPLDAHRNGQVNGNHAVQSTGGRKEDRRD